MVFRETIRSTPEACVPTQKPPGYLDPAVSAYLNARNRLVIRAFELALAAEAFLSLRSQPALETATEQVQYD